MMIQADLSEFINQDQGSGETTRASKVSQNSCLATTQEASQDSNRDTFLGIRFLVPSSFININAC